MKSLVSFPGLGLEFELSRVAFSLFGHDIFWYGVIIAAGFLLAVVFCYRLSPKFGVKPDSLMDMLFLAVPLGLIGARLYYIIFYLDLYRNADGSLDFGKMIRIWDGGLAIYGGVIAAVLAVLLYCKLRHEKFSALLDIGGFGLLIGQAVGRWGNFMNAEAYGSETTLPWRMGIQTWNEALQTWVPKGEVHPTFLYESLWNVVGLVLLIILAKKWRKFDGQMFLTYVLWYGIGRTWIEGLRTDSLYFFGLELFGAPIRTSQVLAAVSAAAALGLLIFNLAIKKHKPEELLCNQVAASEAAGEAARDAARKEAGEAPADGEVPQETNREEDRDHDLDGRERTGGEDQE